MLVVCSVDSLVVQWDVLRGC